MSITRERVASLFSESHAQECQYGPMGTCYRRPEFAVLCTAEPDVFNDLTVSRITFTCTEHAHAEPVPPLDDARAVAAAVAAECPQSGEVWGELVSSYPRPVPITD